MKKVLMNWSGGKDSSLCLYYLLKSNDYEVVGLFTSINDEYRRVSMHGVRESLIKRQAEAIGLPVYFLRIPGQVDLKKYNHLMLNALSFFKERGVEYCVFGDIFLEELRTYREEKLKELNLKGLFPLWGKSTQNLAEQFIDLGFQAVLSSLDGGKLDKSFIGKSYDKQLLNDLPEDVDPCGEYGEFHSFVYDGPLFKTAVTLKKGGIEGRSFEQSTGTNDVSRGGLSEKASSTYWFLDLYESHA